MFHHISSGSEEVHCPHEESSPQVGRGRAEGEVRDSGTGRSPSPGAKRADLSPPGERSKEVLMLLRLAPKK
jgi:hypothetical protein